MKTNFVNEAISNNCLTGHILTILGDKSLAQLKTGSTFSNGCCPSGSHSYSDFEAAVLMVTVQLSSRVCVCAKLLQSYLTLQP